MRVTINKKYKSIPQGLEFQLPRFSVITGKNGSGKSHLLEAIGNKDVSNVTDEAGKALKVIYVPFGALSPQISETSNPMQVNSNLKSIWQQFEGVANQARTYASQHNWQKTDTENWIKSNLQPPLKEIFEKLVSLTSKALLDLKEADVINNLRISDISGNNSNGIFFGQLAEIFQSYQMRKYKNDMIELLNNKYNQNNPFLSEEEFEEKYGPKPWLLINSILYNAGLSYTVNDPEGLDLDSDFKLRLTDKGNGAEISANDLSTGERVLMSLALAVYNTKDGGNRPDLIMLDEPDAPLHPEYSKLLIKTLSETISEDANVNIIITTHSPSTVAMCPDNSLYQIDKASKTPEIISIADGLTILTSGIPHLKVSIEDRLQIFVESKFDVSYYERLYNLLSRKYTYSHKLLFLPPHSGTSNCTDVITITNTLAELGNDLVRGIIDHDNRNNSTDKIFVLGLGNRYSVENYILDPIFICLALIRASKFKFQDFGIHDILTYMESQKLQAAQLQLLADFIFGKLGTPRNDEKDCELDCGYTISYPKEFLKMQGHDYEEKICNAIPELNALKKGQSDSALKMSMLAVIEELPQFLSADIHRTFSSIR